MIPLKTIAAIIFVVTVVVVQSLPSIRHNNIGNEEEDWQEIATDDDSRTVRSHSHTPINNMAIDRGNQNLFIDDKIQINLNKGQRHKRIIVHSERNSVAPKKIAIKAFSDYDESVEDIVPIEIKKYFNKLSTDNQHRFLNKLHRKHHHHHQRQARRHRRAILDVKYFNWLNEQQTTELTELTESGAESKMIWEMVYHFYELTEGEVRDRATENFRTLCGEFVFDILGEDNFATLKTLWESGASKSVIEQKVDEFIGALDSDGKEEADQTAPTCKKVFGIGVTLRRVRKNSLAMRHLKWLTIDQRTELERLLHQSNSTYRDLLHKVDQFYESLDQRQKINATDALKPYCHETMRLLLGDTGFAELKQLKEHSASVDKLIARFHEIVSQIDREDKRIEAEHYADFCKKIYKIEKFDSSTLTSWLTASQKRELAEMIADRNIGDDAVYDRIAQFYSTAVGDDKTRAQEAIESGCRAFIATMFGEDNAQQLDQMKEDGRDPQLLSARLSDFVDEIVDDSDRAKALKSVPICRRIYLQYAGTCNCSGQSDECSSTSPGKCVNCKRNTEGVQCERCIPGFTKSTSNVDGGCDEDISTNNADTICQCNGHSTSGCDETGACLSCDGNTQGLQCEMCADGYYGDATQGTDNDCIKCPCPDALGQCYVNADDLVECRNCPVGKTGRVCDIDSE